MTAAIQPGTVTATSPLLVEVAGDPPGGLPAEQLGQAAIGDVGGVVEGGGRRVWLGPYDPPSTFPPSTHSHTIAQVTNLQTTLNGKASTSHTHTMAQVTGLAAALAAMPRIWSHIFYFSARTWTAAQWVSMSEPHGLPAGSIISAQATLRSAHTPAARLDARISTLNDTNVSVSLVNVGASSLTTTSVVDVHVWILHTGGA